MTNFGHIGLLVLTLAGAGEFPDQNQLQGTKSPSIPKSNDNPASSVKPSPGLEMLLRNYATIQSLAKKKEYKKIVNEYGEIAGIALQSDYSSLNSQQKNRIATTFSIIGLAYGKRNRFEESSGYLEQALAIDPDNIIVHGNYGIFLFDQKKYVDARAHFNEVLKPYPNDETANYYLGLINKAEQKSKK